jgi:hypothetical protein
VASASPGIPLLHKCVGGEFIESVPVVADEIQHLTTQVEFVKELADLCVVTVLGGRVETEDRKGRTGGEEWDKIGTRSRRGRGEDEVRDDKQALNSRRLRLRENRKQGRNASFL